MSEKRRDNKGRLLRNGESQRKDGKYEYKYTDLKGERHSIYSWRLVDTDKLPQGKRPCESLRSLIKKIEKDQEEGIDEFEAKRVTLNDLSYIRLGKQKGLKKSTFLTIKKAYKKHVSEGLGLQKISEINYTIIKQFYVNLVEAGYAISYLDTIQGIINPIFEYAVKSNYIRANPSKGVLSDIKKEYGWKRPKKYSLTQTEQKKLMEYVKNSGKYKRYLPMLIVFLGTGCRIGEFAGLCWDDINFADNTISVSRSLTYLQDEDGKYKYFISTPKTEAGKRVIPMFDDVREVLLELKDRAADRDLQNPSVDGVSGFIFLTRNNTLLNSKLIWSILRNIINSFNAQKITQNGELVVLPEISPHILRHTFCTRLYEAGCNIKAIQEIMGHANINVTMDVYTDIEQSFITKSTASIQNKMLIL